MQQKKSKKILFYFLLLIIFGSINNTEINKVKFSKIKNIQLSGLDTKNIELLSKEIRRLNLQNIYFLDSDELNEIINKNSLVEKYNIFKIYPSTIYIKIKKTKFVAKINKNGQELIIGSNGKFSKKNLSSYELPYIFGTPEINEFLKFKKTIDESQLSYSQIKNLYFFKSKRWDIELKNNILIKLSQEYTEGSLENVFKIMDDNRLKNFKIIDARVKNQIVTYE